MQINIFPTESCILLIHYCLSLFSNLSRLALTKAALYKIYHCFRRIFLSDQLNYFFHFHNIKTLCCALLLRWGLSGQQLEENTSDSIYIAFVCVFPVFSLLWRSICFSKYAEVRFFIKSLHGSTKIAYLQFLFASLFFDKNICWFKVPMNHSSFVKLAIALKNHF